MKVRKSAKVIVTLVVLGMLLVAGLAYGGWWLWQDATPVFRNLTVELGTSQVHARDFLEKAGWSEPVEFQDGQIDYTRLGQQTLSVSCGGRQYTVVLEIVDTTAPTLTLQDVTLPVNQTPVLEDFVVLAEDLSQLQVYFVEVPVPTKDGAAVSVEVAAEDIVGNRTVQTCTLHYLWMHDAVTLELGQQLRAEDVFLRTEDAVMLDAAALEAVNTAPVGTYTLTCHTADGDRTCTVTVQDTTPPELILQEVAVRKGKPLDIADFVVSATDISGEVTIAYETQPDLEAMGEQTVTICATDVHGNTAKVQTILNVTGDVTPPKINGLTTLTVAKGATIDYTQGVSAVDDENGSVSFTYDASKVNTEKAGVYYVTYVAKDNSGNRVEVKRKIEVEPDQADVDALVAEIAAKLPKDAEAIRNYVRNNIRYSGDWGGDDPIWYGFQNRRGNCYVHAMCLDALLRAKGFNIQLIWTTDKSHYWHIIELNGSWKHIDSTPSVPGSHGKYSLMNDAQRLETLLHGSHERDWDRTKWPACP